MSVRGVKMFNLGILGSTRGSSMLPIIRAIEEKKLPAQITLVLSNKADAVILENANKHGLNTVFLNPMSLNSAEYDHLISKQMAENNVNLIVLIGYMRILSAPFVQQWQSKIINVHPSLLPAFGGGMDLNVHQAVLDAQVKETGCTVHFVTEEVDSGPILIQKKCAVLPDDSVETLKKRVQTLEGQALIEAINQIIIESKATS